MHAIDEFVVDVSAVIVRDGGLGAAPLASTNITQSFSNEWAGSLWDSQLQTQYNQSGDISKL